MKVDNEELRNILMAQQWERAKGELRAMAMMQGGMYDGNAIRDPEDVSELIEAFIKDFESNGFHE